MAQQAYTGQVASSAEDLDLMVLLPANRNQRSSSFSLVSLPFFASCARRVLSARVSAV